MDYRVLGDQIASETATEQNAAGATHVAEHAPPLKLPPTPAQSETFALLMMRILATKILDHVVAYGGEVTSPPNVSPGLDMQSPVIVAEVDGDGELVQLWWKSGPEVTDWSSFGGLSDHKFSTDATDEAAGGAGYALDKLSSEGNVKPTLTTTGGARKTRFDVTLPTGFPGFDEQIPEPNGIGDPGSRPLTSHGNHVHPDQDSAGGDLYFVDEFDVETITYYGTPVIGLNDSPVASTSPPGAWDGTVVALSQGGYLGPY